MSMNKNLKIIFMGTPEFSVPVLNSLIQNYNIITVVTQPDKKVGRKQELTSSPVKKVALENKIEVLQPDKIDQSFVSEIKEINPDLIVVVAYGFILPQELLNIPKYGVINIHASLLPKYRGASPIQSAILNGDQVTGVSIMLINEKMDQGPILSQSEADIEPGETFSSLHDKLAILGSHLLIDTLPKYLNQEIKPIIQDDTQATYCQKITKDDGKIDWSKPATEIETMIRAFDPWPETWSYWGDKKLKILAGTVNNSRTLDKAGTILKDGDNLLICTGEGNLQVKKIQLEGKKEMGVKDFLNGYPQIVGEVLK